jgi:hypothetical protein
MKWWTPSPDAVPEMAWYESLVAVSRRARAAQLIWPVFIDDFEFFGRVDRGPRPAISVYGHLLTGQSLLCDESGIVYAYVEPRSGRGDAGIKTGRVGSGRVKAGRFKEVSLRGALWQCGLPEVAEATLTPRPGRHEIDEIDGRERPALRAV